MSKFNMEAMRAAQNTDTHLFSEIEDDYYSPSCRMTKERTLGINVGGKVIIRSLREWFKALDEPILSDSEFNEVQKKRGV